MNPRNVAIVDYGMGNLCSVRNAIEYLGGKSVVVINPNELSCYDKIILPGVGAFAQAITCLHQSGLTKALNDRREEGAHILGICLGMQLMCSVSEEDGVHEGLNWFAAKVKRFLPNTVMAVPHMGWNSVDFERDDPIFSGLTSGGDAYFVHSYHVNCDDSDQVLANTEYGHRFNSVIRNGNVRGIQFHPEKSQDFGLAILRNYLEIPC